jgi:hypothetical protein
MEEASHSTVRAPAISPVAGKAPTARQQPRLLSISFDHFAIVIIPADWLLN